MNKKPKGLTKSGCTRFGKEAIRKEINKGLKEMPGGFYYQYSLEAMSEQEYFKREGEARRIKETT